MERGCTFQDSVKQLPSAKRKGWMHALKKFVPFLDSDRILRVGGRFDYMTDLTDDSRAPRRRLYIGPLFFVCFDSVIFPHI